MSTGNRSTRPRKRILLASGLVVGVAASATLALTVDELHVSTQIKVPAWNVEASFESPTSGYAEYHNRDTGGFFKLDSGQMTPGQVRYAPVHMRMGAKSTIGAYLTFISEPRKVTTEAADELMGAIQFRVVTSKDNTCTKASFDTATNPGNKVLTPAAQNLKSPTPVFKATEPINPAGPDTITLPAAAHAEGEIPVAGPPVTFCFEFTLPSDVVTKAPLANGQSVTIVWETDYRSIT